MREMYMKSVRVQMNQDENPVLYNLMVEHQYKGHATIRETTEDVLSMSVMMDISNKIGEML